jgi:MFS family permease
MAEQTTDQPRVESLALAEPTAHVRRGWITGLGLASLGMWMAAYTPLQVLLPLQLQHITPHHKIVALAVVTGAGAVASGLATPLAGALSDRTTRRYALVRMTGRRHRWTLGMALLGAVSLVILSQQGTVVGVTAAWAAFSAFQNGEYASLSAAIPDHVPVRQRATVAGWVGMPQALGLVVGTAAVVAVFTGQTSGYLVLAVLLAGLALPFVLLTPDHPLESSRRGRRKMIVTVSGTLIAAAALLLTFVETWTAAIGAAAAFGVGFGAYLAVDQALITQVLPAARDRAKDLGVINIAIVCPAAIGALVAAPLVSLGGYPTLFAGTAVVAFLGSILVWRIKNVP